VLVQFALDSAAAKDAQLSLQEAHRQAHLKETEVLAAADAGTAVVAVGRQPFLTSSACCSVCLV
jgi:hypothetical protein